MLQDPEVRQGIKEYSDWPTIPQLYVKGEFVGGSDIMLEMFQSGELQQLVGAPKPRNKKGRWRGTRNRLAPSLSLAWDQVDAQYVAMGVPIRRNGRKLRFS